MTINIEELMNKKSSLWPTCLTVEAIYQVDIGLIEVAPAMQRTLLFNSTNDVLRSFGKGKFSETFKKHEFSSPEWVRLRQAGKVTGKRYTNSITFEITSGVLEVYVNKTYFNALDYQDSQLDVPFFVGGITVRQLIEWVAEGRYYETLGLPEGQFLEKLRRS
ncbi:MAG: hypothetical protein OXR68_05515 [Alphaproteobacteria bacterium]|nr:hypothetical protein [Alphaproteobacteria bacterium]MDD9920062.1 hypothetical protein [Alphaproteobacteria bacterium]